MSQCPFCAGLLDNGYCQNCKFNKNAEAWKDVTFWPKPYNGDYQRRCEAADEMGLPIPER